MNTTLAQGRLERICQVSPFDIDWPLRTLLESLYAQHGDFRAYHNLRHLEEMAAAYVAVRDTAGWHSRETAFAALLMHHAILVEGYTDNAVRSAEFAFVVLPALLPRIRSKMQFYQVARLIRMTSEHGNHSHEDRTLEPDARHFLDCDLSILGASRDRFLEYHADVSREHAGTASPEAYRKSRRAFLERLVRPSHRIYLSDFFHERLERRAKDNLHVALELLR